MKLYNRLSSFYIVINVPKCLRKRIGKSQIWRSLHTKDRRIANLRAGMIKMSVHKLFTEEQMKEAQEIDGMLRDISCDGIGHSEMDYTEDFAEMVAYEACREKVNYAKTYLVSEMIEEYQQKLKIYRDTYKQGDYKLAYNALTVTVAKHYYPMPTDETMHIALNAMMRAEIQFLEYAIAYIKGSRQNLVGQLITDVDEYVGSRKVYPSTPDVSQVQESAFNLVELTELYNNDISRDNTSDEQKEKVLLRMKVVAEVMGDMSISKITDKDIENFIREIKNLPAHYGKMKLSKKLTNKQAIEMGKKDNNIQKISVGTVDKYVSSLKTILQYATMKEYIPKNPFDKISLPKADKRKVNESKRLPFTLKQLQAIFEMRVFKSSRNYKFWIPMLALYTGARLNELCQLLVNDIKFDGDIAFFSINDDGDKKLKTSAAVRIVPIHSELVKMGFMDYVKEMREKKSVRLFPELKKEKKSGRYPDDFVEESTLKDKLWWMSASINVRTKMLTIMFYDEGIGIPKSLPRTYPEIFRSLGGLLNDDAQLIQAATKIKRSSTNKKNRGRGLKDIKDYVKSVNNGMLKILSQRGEYAYFSNEKEYIKNRNIPLCGTLIQWKVPINIGE